MKSVAQSTETSMSKLAIAIISIFAAWTNPAQAQFADSLFSNPRVKTDYVSPTEGTYSNPLTIGNCLYTNDSDPILITLCNPVTPTIWPQSNQFEQGASRPNYWVLSANNENFRSTLNSGPPNQSEPVYIPQEMNNLLEFTILTNSLPGESKWRAHMIADHTPNGLQNPQGPGGIPFLGLGADSRRGNGQPVGYLNNTTGMNSTFFASRIWAAVHPGTGVALMYVYAMTEWKNSSGKTIPRGIFVALYHEGTDHSTSTQSCDPNVDGAFGGQGYCSGIHKHWNWPIEESFFYPGADWVYIDAEDAGWVCGENIAVSRLNLDTGHAVNWEHLFECLSPYFDDPMPSTEVPLLGVHWAVEVSGAGNAIWASVDSMLMLRNPQILEGGSLDAVLEKATLPVISTEWADPVTVDQIQEKFWASCRLNKECFTRHYDRIQGKAIELNYEVLSQPLGTARDHR